jgi:hypothetical protein
MKTLCAVAIALPLSIVYPVMGVAEAPDKVKEVMLTQEVEQRMEEASGKEEGIVEQGLGFLIDKSKAMGAGAVSIYDGFRNTSEREEKLKEDISDLEIQIAEWKSENAKLRKNLNESIVHQGVQHSRLVQCSMDLTEYLKAIPAK